MTLGGLHGRGMVHSTTVGAPMVPRGQVIHHQQRCGVQQQIATTMCVNNDFIFHKKFLPMLVHR